MPLINKTKCYEKDIELFVVEGREEFALPTNAYQKDSSQ